MAKETKKKKPAKKAAKSEAEPAKRSGLGYADKTWDERLDDLEKRRQKALGMGGKAKLDKRHNQGQLNARERIDKLIDPGTFLESGLFGTSGVYPEDAEKTPTDGKITGYGKINGRDVAFVVNDFTVKGASTSATNSKKLGWVKTTAQQKGIPMLFVGESTGARLPDAMGSRGMGQLLGNDKTQFMRDRTVPWAAAALGFSFGSSAWLTCCSDFAVMRKGSCMAVSSPKLVSKAIGREVDLEELGGWKLHTDTTGLIDHAVDSDEEAMETLRKYLSYMPSNNRETPPRADVPEGSGAEMEDLHTLIPERRTQVYNVKKVLERIFDKDSLFEMKPRFGKPAVTALARLDGHVVGIIANNPIHKAGSMDVEAIDKMIAFQVLCDSFNIPIIKFVDTPGFFIGLEAERQGAPGHIMNFMNSTCLVSVPTLTVIMRKSYGRAYVAMGGGKHSDDIVCWPTAEISFMDPIAATKIVHNKEPDDEDFGEAFTDIAQESDVWGLAQVYSTQDVIPPSQTRDYLIRMLEIHRLRLSNGVGKHLMQYWPTTI
ncbi:MAG: carboxyl transferase domain-containing protein [Rhodospirillaceae bacterium]|jgi:acetyl-CoA carboxylase carboxyltransferase component